MIILYHKFKKKARTVFGWYM